MKQLFDRIVKEVYEVEHYAQMADDALKADYLKLKSAFERGQIQDMLRRELTLVKEELEKRAIDVATLKEEELEGGVEKEYFGNKGDQFFYLVKQVGETGEPTDLLIVDAEDNAIFSAKEKGLALDNVKAFLMSAIQEVDIANIAYDIVMNYDLLGLKKKEEEKPGEEPKAEEKPKEEAPAEPSKSEAPMDTTSGAPAPEVAAPAEAPKESKVAVEDKPVNEQDKLLVIARGIMDKLVADGIATSKKGQVVADDADPKKFMVVVKEQVKVTVETDDKIVEVEPDEEGKTEIEVKSKETAPAPEVAEPAAEVPAEVPAEAPAEPAAEETPTEGKVPSLEEPVPDKIQKMVEKHVKAPEAVKK